MLDGGWRSGAGMCRRAVSVEKTADREEAVRRGCRGGAASEERCRVTGAGYRILTMDRVCADAWWGAVKLMRFAVLSG